jgi:two-component system response regulator RegX3
VAKIKIIDDDTELAENVAMLLRREGHQVSIRAQTAGAVPELETEKTELLILDVMFPENPAAGFDLAREIRRSANLRDLPIILLTSINQEYPMDFSGRDIDPDWMPVQDFVEKPVDIADLTAKIGRLLSRPG